MILPSDVKTNIQIRKAGIMGGEFLAKSSRPV
jgi:hypothetical protein